MATGGRPILATLVKQKYAPSPFFSNEALNNLQKRLNCSDRKLLILANFLRVYAGKVSVEAHTQEFLTERNNIFRTFFDHKMVTMSEYFTPEGAAKGVRQKRETEVPVA